MENLSCSFFGHRKIKITDELKQRVKDIIEKLIIKENVLIFLFGSKSNFDSLCHLIVSELKEKYPKIKRISFTCKSETCVLESERQSLEEVYSYFRGKEVHLLGVEEEIEHKTKYTSGRASYIERNRAMIKESDFCIFYYDENYMPQERKFSKRSVCYYQPRSGTKLAYEFAKQKRKNIINIF